jgi:hypothetical protein
MTQIRFWNTTIDSNLDISTIPNEQLVEFLCDLVTEDTYNNGGSFIGELGDFYQKVKQEILKRMGHAPS